MFLISDSTLNRDQLVNRLSEEKAGAIVVFEGWVRNHNEGKPVSSLEYQVYHELAQKEGERILAEAKEKFNLHAVHCVHREGHLKLGEIAVWIGATASHRDDAFKATRYVIDEVKHRLPVWKKEHYVSAPADWVFCRHHSHHVHFHEADYYQKQSKLVDQTKLKERSVAVIGAGGLGCPALMALASAGVGKLTVFDHDSIAISNIHRQPLFAPHLVGEKKSVVAAQRLSELNPFIEVTPVVTYLGHDNARDLLQGNDLILDCTDNLKTKWLIHDVALTLDIPLVSASIWQHEGQIRTFVRGKGCLRCFSETTPDDSLIGNCNDFGVLGTTTMTIGSLQASEALSFLLHGTNSSIESSVYFDLASLSQHKIKNLKREECPSCLGEFERAEELLEVGTEDLSKDLKILDIRNLSDAEVLAQVGSHKIALCCHRGVRSFDLTKKLRAAGHSHVYSLKGGACSL